MSAKIKMFLVIIAIGLTMFVVGLFISFMHTSALSNELVVYGLLICETTGAILLFTQGNFKNSRPFRFFKLFIAFFIIGLLLRLLHLPYAKLLFVFSYLGFFCTYAIYYFQKIEKRKMDVIKLVWVGIVMFDSIGVLLINYEVDLQMLTSLLIIILVIDFLRLQRYVVD